MPCKSAHPPSLVWALIFNFHIQQSSDTVHTDNKGPRDMQIYLQPGPLLVVYDNY